MLFKLAKVACTMVPTTSPLSLFSVGVINDSVLACRWPLLLVICARLSYAVSLALN